jgi:hypothetical protein
MPVRGKFGINFSSTKLKVKAELNHFGGEANGDGANAAFVSTTSGFMLGFPGV